MTSQIASRQMLVQLRHQLRIRRYKVIEHELLHHLLLTALRVSRPRWKTWKNLSHPRYEKLIVDYNFAQVRSVK